MKKQMCKKYPQDEVLPNEKGNCSLCNGNCTESEPMEQAKNVIRHSIVRYDGELWMLENGRRGKATLIRGTFGKEIKPSTEVRVIKYPAQLAQDFLENFPFGLE